MGLLEINEIYAKMPLLMLNKIQHTFETWGKDVVLFSLGNCSYIPQNLGNNFIL